MGGLKTRYGRAVVWLLSIAVAGCTNAAGPSSSAAVPSGSETTFQQIKATKTITLAFANEPPYTIAQTENVSGQDPETLKAIMGKYGVEKYQGVLVDFAGMIPGLLAKRFDVISAGMTITPERCEQVAFSNPILASVQGLGVAIGNPKNLHSYKDIASDPGVKVGMDRGASQLPLLEIAGVKPDQILQFDKTGQTVAALETGRVDAIVVLHVLLKNYVDVEQAKFEIADPFETPLDASGKPIEQYTGDAFRKEDNDLREAYNEGLAEITASGELLSILQTFGFPDKAVPPQGVTAEQLCAAS